MTTTRLKPPSWNLSRGRWFLEEYARRHRSADTKILLDAIGKLENLMIARSSTLSQGSGQAEITSLLNTIRKTRSEIAAVRNHLLADGGAIEDNPALFDRLAETARTAANHLMSRTEALQQTSRTLRADSPDNPAITQIDGEVGGLQSLAWTQDVLSQRIAKAMGLLSHIDERVSALAGENPQAAGRQAPGSKLSYFKQDEEIFAPVETKPAIKIVAAPKPAAKIDVEPVPEPEKRARVIVKRYAPEQEITEAPTPTAAAATEVPEFVMPAETTVPLVEAPATIQAEAPKPSLAQAASPERKRVVIVRRKSGDSQDIPLTNEIPESGSKLTSGRRN